MAYANLLKKFETTGRIKLKGGQCEGRVEVPEEKTHSSRYIPSRGKGAEYASKYRAEEEQTYFESMTKPMSHAVPRLDVTSNESSEMEVPEELTSIGTVPNVQELNREQFTQVYSRYDFTPIDPPEHLETIFNEKEKILQLIESNQVCVIKGPTGCGKSTQIPQFILNEYAAKQRHCNIVVTQPRRIAAISLAQRVCKERNHNWGEPGGLVGYQVGLDKKLDEDTRLLYCTTGVLLEKLINDKNLLNYTHIILDEVHEREEDMDFLMLIVRKFLRTNSPNVKVVLMSATIDTSRFAKYFEVIIRNKKESAPSYEIKRESKYKVQVYFIDALDSLGPVKSLTFSEDEPGISQEAYMLVPMMIRAFNRIDLEDYRCKRCAEKKGAVLIFLPGLHQIETLHEILYNEEEKQKKDAENPDVFNLWLCPLHSSITKSEQENVTKLPPEGKRKVILSTNIAESSLTIPDVKYVIDFCLTKHLVADTVTGFTSLQMAWASHNNCEQREGRVGRVQDGRVYRMVKKSFYQFKMAKESVPEMLRCPLEVIVLKCKRLLVDECPLRLISNALDPPDLDNYEKTILKLKEIGGLLTTCQGRIDPNDGDLTFLGRVMGSLPVDIHITKMIMLGHMLDVLEDAIVMGSAMTVRNLFSEPFQQRLSAYNNRLLWADSSESDAIAYLNAYSIWRQMTGLGRFERSRGSEEQWGRMFMLQMRHLKEMCMQEEDIKKRLRHFNIEVIRHNRKPLWTHKEKPLILKLCLAGAFYPNYFSCSAQNPNAEMEAVKMLGGHNPYHSVYLQNIPHPAPLYFDQVKQILRGNGISDHMELHHDSSQKLIVEFKQIKTNQRKVGDRNQNDQIPGDIVMPVYRAIKMRQLNIPITIRVDPPIVAQKKLNYLLTKSTSSMISLSGQSSEYQPVIPWDQQMVELSICHVEDAGHFYGHIWPSTSEKLRKVHMYLNKYDLLCELSGEVEESTIYAAPFRDEGEHHACYYRAKVVKISSRDKQSRYVDVFFIDYGNSTKFMPEHELREIVNEDIQKELDQIPPLAVECVLAEVAPGYWTTKEGHWGKEATDYVTKKLCSPDGRNTWPTQIYSCVNGVASVYLFLEEEGRGGKPPLTLNNDLVQQGFARYKEESYLSKRNHEKREEIARGEMSFDSINDSEIFKSKTNDFLKTLPFSEGPVRHLKGPHSPLEMKLYSKIKSCCQKEVKVEWNSVNSVLLDSDPTDPHEKLLVAGYVSQTADGRKLMLSHTSVLPPIKGLASLVCLIFAPTVELRSDEFRSRYTGALCGLGCDTTGNSMFPENDMEIKFDVEFKNDDLVNVNKVRYFLNERFCSLSNEDMSEHRVQQMQRTIRELLLKLLKTEPRQSVKVEHCPYPYRWGLLSENHKIPPYEATVDDDEYLMLNGIYTLHYAIDLNPSNDSKYIQELVKKVNNLMSCVHTDLQPKELICDLCDLDFPYWTQLRQHVTSYYHKQLIKWLKLRAAAHGLSLNLLPPRPVVTTTQPPMSKPPTSQQPRPSTSRY